MKLFVPSYPSAERHDELISCLRGNLETFEQVVVVGEPWETGIEHEGLLMVNTGARPTYGELLGVAERMVPKGEVFMLANVDMEILPGGVDFAQGLPPRSAYALGRWQEGSDALTLQPRAIDVWVLRAPVPRIRANFTQGRLFCHAVFNGLLKNAGLKIMNPCHEIITIHHHAAESPRTYGIGVVDRVQGPCCYPVPDLWCLKNNLPLGTSG